MLRTFLRAAFVGTLFASASLLAEPAMAQASRPAKRATSRPAKPASTPAKPTAPAPEAAPGTFQLVRLTQKMTVTITSDALAEIERRRQDNDEVSWLISPYARVRILPRRVINAPGFQPLEPVANAY